MLGYNQDVSVEDNDFYKKIEAFEKPDVNDLDVLMESIKNVPPMIDGDHVVLPTVANENVSVSLYGSSNKAVVAMDGSFTQPLEDMKLNIFYKLTNNETGETKAYLIPYGSRIKVLDGQVIEAGDELTEGSVNPHDILKIKGVRAVQDYMIQEVQRVYRLQGVDINDKHIEVIVRQMLKKIRIENSGDTDYLPGTLVDVLDYEEINENLKEQGKEPAEGSQVMLGITKASLATNSFLSAASFQETTKVLTDAAIKGKVDPLIGLKENVLIGKLIPAGTGMRRYRSTRLNTDATPVMEAALEEETVIAEDFEEVIEEEIFEEEAEVIGIVEE